MRKLFFSFSAIGFFCIFSQARAAGTNEIPELTRFIHQEITTVSRAVEGASVQDDSIRGSGYFLMRFMIRVTSSVGIEVPWIAKAAIVPNVELVFTRKMPK